MGGAARPIVAPLRHRARPRARNRLRLAGVECGPLRIRPALQLGGLALRIRGWPTTVFGGRQSARTLHFFVSGFLVLFLVVHVTMVVLAGFRTRMRAMITGRTAIREERV